MSSGIDGFNNLPASEAEHRLHLAFADHKWAARLAADRPYADLTALLTVAEQAWCELESSDWLEAMAAHPRIGERGGHSPAASEREQSEVRQAPADTLTALADENRRYEERFGFVFLIAAAGRSADEILAELRRRMDNDRETELAVAAEELRKITRMRLRQMVGG